MKPAASKLASQMKSLRASTSLSCRQLARLAGLTHGHVSQIERECRFVSSDTLASIAAVFGITLDWLYFERGEKPTDSSLAAAVARANRRAARAKAPRARRAA